MEEEPTKREQVAQAAKGAVKGAAKKAIKKYLLQALAGAGAGYVVGCLIIILLVAAGFGVALYLSGEAPATGNTPGSASPINVPCVRQRGPGQCGRASTAMVVRYWRPDLSDWYPDTADIGNQVRTLTNKNYIDAGDASADNFQAIIKSLQAGNPVIIATSFYRSASNPYGHIFVLTGYDSNTETFYYNDTFWDAGADCRKTTTRDYLSSHLDHSEGRWYLYIPT